MNWPEYCATYKHYKTEKEYMVLIASTIYCGNAAPEHSATVYVRTHGMSWTVKAGLAVAAYILYLLHRAYGELVFIRPTSEFMEVVDPSDPASRNALNALRIDPRVPRFEKVSK